MYSTAQADWAIFCASVETDMLLPPTTETEVRGRFNRRAGKSCPSWVQREPAAKVESRGALESENEVSF